jgi:serine/threonine-protein kinase
MDARRGGGEWRRSADFSAGGGVFRLVSIRRARMSSGKNNVDHKGFDPSLALSTRSTGSDSRTGTTAVTGVDDLTGRIFDNYRITKRIAMGGAGTVYRAQNLKYKFPLAVKIMHVEKAANKKDVAACEQEYEIGRALHHPGILQYLDFGRFEGRPYIVMDYFDGSPLAKVWRDAKAAPAFRFYAKDFFIQLADIVATLHRAGIIHRDIKPGNFLALYDRESGEPGERKILEGKEWRFKLIDFSVSARVPTGLLKWFGGSKEIVGTPTYMSPEQIQKKAPSPSMDIYSFGVMMFEFFTGRLPFAGTNQNELLNLILQKAPPPLSKYCPDVTNDLEQLVSRMLAKIPEMRPPSMEQLINMLRRMEMFSH